MTGVLFRVVALPTSLFPALAVVPNGQSALIGTGAACIAVTALQAAAPGGARGAFARVFAPAAGTAVLGAPLVQSLRPWIAGDRWCYLGLVLLCLVSGAAALAMIWSA